MQDDYHPKTKQSFQSDIRNKPRVSKIGITNTVSYVKGKPKRTVHLTGMNFVDNFLVEIPNIINIFLEKTANRSKVQSFITKSTVKEGYDYLLAVIKTFPDFNLFDYLSDIMVAPVDNAQIEKRRQFYIQRNNLFLTILLYSKIGKDRDIYMDRQVEYFVRVNQGNFTTLDYEVDYLFLSILGYRDKAKSLLVKYNDHFKDFIKDFRDNDVLTFFQKLTIDKQPSEMSIEEIIALRKIINATIFRKFYNGFVYLLSSEANFIIMMEGRLWKNIILEFTKEEVLEIWINYDNIFKYFMTIYQHLDIYERKEIKKKLYFHSIGYEYESKIKKLKEEEENLIEKEILTKDLTEFETLVKQKEMFINEREELQKEINLHPIVEFVDLLQIIFMYNKKEVALTILDSDRTEINPSPAIFEICLNNDEDLAM